jgi:hypothetical protein
LLLPVVARRVPDSGPSIGIRLDHKPGDRRTPRLPDPCLVFSRVVAGVGLDHEVVQAGISGTAVRPPRRRLPAPVQSTGNPIDAPGPPSPNRGVPFA